jgi:HSP20 family molecular chaperone IbpA
MIKPTQHHSQLPTAEPTKSFRQPHFECNDLPQALELKVYVPGVDANGVEITTLGPDLGITARKAHLVRVNWSSLHLEGAQRDYQLRLRLGFGYDYAALRAELADGVLTLHLPKVRRASARLPDSQRRVA